MRHLVYLGVLAGCLACVAWLEPVLRVGVLRQGRRIAATLLCVAVPFAVVDLVAVRLRWWSFDPGQIIGVRVAGLPIEELAFFAVVPVCAILGFEAVRTVLRRWR